jgi:hypothetical protein
MAQKNPDSNEGAKSDNASNFVFESVASQSFGDHLADTDGQDLQAEHINMRVIDCINYSHLMEEGPAHRLIIVLRPLGTGQG